MQVKKPEGTEIGQAMEAVQEAAAASDVNQALTAAHRLIEAWNKQQRSDDKQLLPVPVATAAAPFGEEAAEVRTRTPQVRVLFSAVLVSAWLTVRLRTYMQCSPCSSSDTWCAGQCAGQHAPFGGQY